MPPSASRIPADDTGRPIEALPAGARLVSLVPSITELLCDLGAADQLAGVSRYCTHPPDVVAAIEKVGGTKNPDCARIAALRPDMVFLDRDENRSEDFAALTEAGLDVFVAHPRTADAVARTVGAIGGVVGRSERAAAIAAEIGAATERGAPAGRTPLRVFCPIWRNPWMSFGDGIYAADLLRQAGGATVCADDEAYPKVSLAEIAARQPEVILLPDEPYVFRAEHIESMRELRDTPAWRSGRIHLVDGKMLFWYGARTAPALRTLRELLA